MRYAITYENNMVFQHFGKTPQFLIVDLEDGKLTQELVSTDDKGHGALVGFLKEHCVDMLICGGIGQGARDALTAVNIGLISGAKGAMEDVLSALTAGTLKDNPSGMCNHHHEGEGHSCTPHSCIH